MRLVMLLTVHISDTLSLNPRRLSPSSGSFTRTVWIINARFIFPLYNGSPYGLRAGARLRSLSPRTKEATRDRLPPRGTFPLPAGRCDATVVFYG